MLNLFPSIDCLQYSYSTCYSLSDLISWERDIFNSEISLKWFWFQKYVEALSLSTVLTTIAITSNNQSRHGQVSSLQCHQMVNVIIGQVNHRIDNPPAHQFTNINFLVISTHFRQEIFFLQNIEQFQFKWAFKIDYFNYVNLFPFWTTFNVQIMISDGFKEDRNW